MINAEITWGTTTTHIQTRYARGIGDFIAELAEGRRGGTCTILHDDGDAVIPYADVREVTCTWTR